VATSQIGVESTSMNGDALIALREDTLTLRT
jgi:hypothetical protein